MSDDPVNYQRLIKQYLRSILDIVDSGAVMEFLEMSLLYELLNNSLHLFYNRQRFLLKEFTRRSQASRRMPLAS